MEVRQEYSQSSHIKRLMIRILVYNRAIRKMPVNSMPSDVATL